MGLPGSGLAKGLAITLRTMTRRSVTAHYPDVQPELPARSRGVIGLFEENCTVCMLCARECPDWCIYIDSHKETVPATTPGGRDRSRNVLDRFAIDFSLCMYCGICIEVCPFDALFWSPEFEYAETDIHELTHEREKLREWMWTVPEPPPLDPAAEEPKEVGSARKAADKLAVQLAAQLEQERAQQERAEAAEPAGPDAGDPGPAPADGAAGPLVDGRPDRPEGADRTEGDRPEGADRPEDRRRDREGDA
ncbi:4Fe-4S binding protein [Streptomyces sp. XM4193]|uniref:NuoI/complex I 23 kDa subunit family protein n=1 Tax=Streptomyces sp. XM4193 TaxID=2929782 RepID=UPI001FFC27B3|nr:NADH-quinone oxidoreductase subunit I [Streptomyces sp. XM4193]MCK1795396.1 4Fe-4S binding protein [Streptomyces sp. XM4193]